MRITAPSGNVTIVPGTTLDVAATASDFDGYIDRVEFFVRRFACPHQSRGAPWLHVDGAHVQRNYTLLARAYDKRGCFDQLRHAATRSRFTPTILPPSVSIAAPGRWYPPRTRE